MSGQITTRDKLHALREDLKIADQCWRDIAANEGITDTTEIEFDLDVKRAILRDYEELLKAEQGSTH